MCDPVSLGATAVVGASIGSAILSIQGQQQNRDAQLDYQQQLMNANQVQQAENRALATQSYLLSVQGEQRQQRDEMRQAAEQTQDIQRQRHQHQSTALVAAAEGGVDGLSVQNLLFDFHKQEGRFLERVNMKSESQNLARDYRFQQYEHQYNARYNQVKPYIPSPVNPVDYIGPILGIVSSAGRAGIAKGAGSTPNVRGGADGGGGGYGGTMDASAWDDTGYGTGA